MARGVGGGVEQKQVRHKDNKTLVFISSKGGCPRDGEGNERGRNGAATLVCASGSVSTGRRGQRVRFSEAWPAAAVAAGAGAWCYKTRGQGYHFE